MSFRIGIDVGNFDTKTQHTNTPSGYVEYSIKPALSKEYLKYNGSYYAPTINRFEYVKDKTENEHALILSLFGIAKEILYEANAEGFTTKEDVQNYINNIQSISIGVGLPVGDFSKLKQKTNDYYIDKLGNRNIEFEYSDYTYKLTLNTCITFPQDLLPVAANKDCIIANKYKKYLIIGIGGQTVDLIPVVEGVPVAEHCSSLRLGVRKMFTDIINYLDINYGITLGEDTVESVIKGDATALSEDMKTAIYNQAQLHAEKIINACVQKGFNFIEYPVVYYGGGCMLLKNFLEQIKDVTVYEFLGDVNANAKFYAEKAKD